MSRAMASDFILRSSITCNVGKLKKSEVGREILYQHCIADYGPQCRELLFTQQLSSCTRGHMIFYLLPI